MKRSRFLIVLLAMTCCSIAMANGRRPDDEEKDNFPDYNRMDVHKRVPDAPPPISDQPPTNVPAAPPALNSPMNAPPSDEDTPKAPPKAVPLPDGASEPPLPDEIKNNLIQGTTDQK
jgi:hypothetical protein